MDIIVNLDGYCFCYMVIWVRYSVFYNYGFKKYWDVIFSCLEVEGYSIFFIDVFDDVKSVGEFMKVYIEVNY